MHRLACLTVLSAVAVSSLAACGGGASSPVAAPTPAEQTTMPGPATSPAADPTPVPAAVDRGPAAADGWCSASGLCWLEPEPQGAALTGVFIAGATDAWATGPRGAMLRWDSLGWSRVPTGFSGRVWAVWGAASDDVWAVGDAILHFDGAAWRVVRSAPAGQSYYAVHGSGADDVWAVGSDGAVARFDGRAWTDGTIPFAAPEVDALRVFAVGGGAWVIGSSPGAVARFSGGAWQLETLEAGALDAIWGSGPDDVWVAGSARYLGGTRSGSNVFRWDGAAWTAHDVPGAEDVHWTAAAGAGPGDVWLAAGAGTGGAAPDRARWDGATWATSRVGVPTASMDVRGGLGFAVGEAGAIARLQGGSWTVEHAGHPHWVSDVAARDGVAWVAAHHTLTAGATTLLRYAGGATTEVSMGVSELVYGVAATEGGVLWVATRTRGLASYDGTRWEMDVGGIASAGGGAEGGPPPVRGVWASGPSDVWALLGSELAHWDGARMERHPVEADYLERAWGSAPDDVWAVGDVGSAHHWDGQRWAKVPLPVDGLTLDVWGRSRSDVWIVGDDGLALHYDGAAWSRVETGTQATLNAVTGDEDGTVWIAGSDGTVLEWRAGAFVALDTGSFGWLNGAAWDPALGLVVGGDEGVLRRAR